jgi:hypothetical protein
MPRQTLCGTRRAAPGLKVPNHPLSGYPPFPPLAYGLLRPTGGHPERHRLASPQGPENHLGSPQSPTRREVPHRPRSRPQFTLGTHRPAGPPLHANGQQRPPLGRQAGSYRPR